MGGARVLLVEDESSLLALLKRHLERVGYSVVACDSAEAALDVVRRPEWEPQVLVTDETLPGITGSSLAGTLLVRFPMLTCLLCSGYPISLDSFPVALRPRTAILQKPYMPAALEQAIRERLAAAAKVSPAGPAGQL